MKAICGKIKVSFYGGQKICAIIFTAGILNASRKPRPCQSSLRFTGQDKRNLVPFRSLRRIMRGTLIILLRHSTGQERIFGSEGVGLERGGFFWQYIRQSWI